MGRRHKRATIDCSFPLPHLSARPGDDLPPIKERRFVSRTDPAAAASSPPTDDSPVSHQTPPTQPGVVVPLNGAVPDYLRDTYTWAYLSRLGTRVFDRQPVVNAILWGNARRLIRWVTSQLRPGQHVMQPAAVYGSFSRDLAAALGPDGRLEVSDVAPIQVALTRRKLSGVRQAEVACVDATTRGRGPYDAVTCFFLLHEVPDAVKTQVVDALLDAVKPGGQVIFVDYHRPHALHPLRPIMALVFRSLEPFAPALWQREIRDYASAPDRFSWRKDTLFGGLYQRVIAKCHG